MTRYVDFLLIGGGPASVTAAETLRDEGAEGVIAIMTAESCLPYWRPALSKQFLLGSLPRDRLDMFSAAYYQKKHIEILLGTKAKAIDSVKQAVHSEQGDEVRYGKLLIATGSRPNRPEIPGCELQGIFCLRTLSDAEAIRAATENGANAVVIGGNFIGMEVASSLRQMGLAVTLVVRENALFDRLNARDVSDYFLRYYREHGIDVLLEDFPSEFQGDGHIQQVVTNAGRTIQCDVAVLGIGVTPEIEFLQGSGIEADNGIFVDHCLRTNQPNIFAAGDVANFFDPVFEKRRRIEHCDNAVKQGRVAAKNMLGQGLVYSEVSYFFSDVFDLSFEFFGHTSDIDERVERGSLEERSFALLYLKDNVARALFSLGRPAQETKAVESLISHRVNIGAFRERLPDPDFELDGIPAQTVLILQGGGAVGALECGVFKALEEAGIYPDIIAGVSIGAFNGAIAAGNPGKATAALESFWNDLAIETIDVGDERLRQMLSSWQVLLFGSPRFFRPRWFSPASVPSELPFNWTSFYDPSPVKDLLRKYVDFSRLKSSPVRLLVNAVNVETAELETFDSYTDDLTPDHILASGSLPPGFPWTAIDGQHYWDGGIISNSPLEQVIEHCGGTGKRVFIIDLYSSRKALPKDLAGVMARHDEIVYSERIRKDVRTQELIHDFRSLIETIMNFVPIACASPIKQWPAYVQLMGDTAPLKITRIVHEGEEGELPQKDYDFSRKSIEQHKRAGYLTAKRELNRQVGEL